MDDNDFNKMLENAENEALADLHKDVGHSSLLTDLIDLMLEAKNLQFHDMLNTRYPTPKIELERKLRVMANAVMEGKYDN